MVLFDTPAHVRYFFGLLANTARARRFLLRGVEERRDLTENLLYGSRPTGAKRGLLLGVLISSPLWP